MCIRDSYESRPERLLLICAGTGEVEALEDVIGAGALCDLLWDDLGQSASDTALIARDHYLNSCDQLYESISQAKNAQRLLSIAGLADDVEFCLQRDAYPVVGEMRSNGWVSA